MQILVTTPTNKTQFEQIAKMHKEGITEGFLSTLGIPFLSALYKGIASDKSSGVSIAINEHGKVVGFVSYSLDVTTCYKNVISKNFIELCIAILPNIFKISIYKKIFETLIYPFKKTAEKSAKTKQNNTTLNNSNKKRPELLSMAVSTEARGAGIGKQLVKEVDRWMLNNGVTGYHVVTHAIDERSNSFYQRCGFDFVESFENHGKPMNEYYKGL